MLTLNQKTEDWQCTRQGIYPASLGRGRGEGGAVLFCAQMFPFILNLSDTRHTGSVLPSETELARHCIIMFWAAATPCTDRKELWAHFPRCMIGSQEFAQADLPTVHQSYTTTDSPRWIAKFCYDKQGDHVLSSSSSSFFLLLLFLLPPLLLLLLLLLSSTALMPAIPIFGRHAHHVLDRNFVGCFASIFINRNICRAQRSSQMLQGRSWLTNDMQTLNILNWS